MGTAPVHPWAGRRILVATMHAKGAAILPALAGIGLAAEVLELDTDRFGTFTGEVERTGSMLEAARAKARAALDIAAAPDAIAIASEGAFGPDPVLGFLPCARELLLAIDARTGREIVQARRSLETNFASLDWPADEARLEAFLSRARFPGHALIVAHADGRFTKGIAARAGLSEALDPGRRPVRVETDMRAHMNPTRMGEIAVLARTLAGALATPCPACAQPGFAFERALAGLACIDCGTPTGLARAELLRCSACGHEAERARRDARTHAEPGECPACNP